MTTAQTLFEQSPVTRDAIKALQGEIVGSTASGTLYWFPDHSVVLLMFAGEVALIGTHLKRKPSPDK